MGDDHPGWSVCHDNRREFLDPALLQLINHVEIPSQVVQGPHIPHEINQQQGDDHNDDNGRKTTPVAARGCPEFGAGNVHGVAGFAGTAMNVKTGLKRGVFEWVASSRSQRQAVTFSRGSGSKLIS